jgi:hypothetical protein
MAGAAIGQLPSNPDSQNSSAQLPAILPGAIHIKKFEGTIVIKNIAGMSAWRIRRGAARIDLSACDTLSVIQKLTRGWRAREER